MKMKETCYPDDVKMIKRDDILKYILSADPKAKRNKCVEDNIEQIKEAYPIVKWAEDAFHTFHTFHTSLKEKDPSGLDEFWEKYAGSSLDGFCENIKNRLAWVCQVKCVNFFDFFRRSVYDRRYLSFDFA